MHKYDFFLASSLQKVFADERPSSFNCKSITILNGDCINLQLVYILNDFTALYESGKICVCIESEFESVKMFDVELVPSNVPGYPVDENYIRSAPGMYPDLLVPTDGVISPIFEQYRSVWINIATNGVNAGEYEVAFKVYYSSADSNEKEELFSQNIIVNVLSAKLPENEVIHTEWLHADCIADYYGIEVFSEKFWEYLENFISYAVDECAVNMILTPIFTPPLDTDVGGERTTVQLVDVVKNGDKYEFSFDNLAKWCDIADKCGIRYIEVSHLFAQWGAKQTPKIIARVNGVPTKIFGWHVEATDPSYRLFLEAFIPKLLDFFKARGYNNGQVYFHVSDEPHSSNLDSYAAAKSVVKDLLNGYSIMDALSDVELFKQGVVEIPIPANDHIEPFAQLEIRERWVYYCIAQKLNVPNRFFSMSNTRTRILGVLLYLYDMSGFLHWGYNFYNSQYSLKNINPFLITDADKKFSSGDPFLVYPGENGVVLGSVRSRMIKDAFDDVAALKLLEKLTDKKTVTELVHEGLDYTMKFTRFPNDDEYLLNLREAVNKKIAENS